MHTHTIQCQAASIIAAVENLRDAEGMELPVFRRAMESGLLLEAADDYLATGTMTCTCEPTPARAVTIGNGTAVHTAYMVGANVTGSLCNPYAWERSRVRFTDQAATCPRCAKATTRAAESARQAVQA